MGNLRIVKKVTAFITRPTENGSDLLVFEHPTAGLQVPAGTVELGEEPGETVIREVFEESGLRAAGPFRFIDLELEAINEDERVILRTTKMFDEPSYDSSSEGHLLTRGSPVIIKRVENDFALVLSDPTDPSVSPEIRRQGVEGYVRKSVLGDKIERYFYHSNYLEETQDNWQIQVDGHVFNFFWVPLSRNVRIHPGQQPWLDRYLVDLMDTAS